MPTASNHRKTDLATFEALDKLPAALRREVCFAARVWDATYLLQVYQDAVRQMGYVDAVQWLTASIRAGDEQDVLTFARQFQAKFRQPLPHRAAGATILGYRKPVRQPALRRRPRLGGPAKVAWRSTDRLLPYEVSAPTYF